jgi:peptidyl-prolyl cis-trans isomerase D
MAIPDRYCTQGNEMLETLRSATNSMFVKILLGLLVISFAVWGGSGAFVGGGATEAIRVGNTRVSTLDYRLAYRSRISALEQQLNQRLTAEQAKLFGLQQLVTDQLVAGAILDESAKAMGLGLSDDSLAKLIAADPTFKDAFGNFSRANLQAILRSIGMNEDSFVKNQHSTALRRQLVSGLSQGTAAPDALGSAVAQYQTEKRVFEYVLLDAGSVPPVAAPDDATLAKWFEANQQNFVAPQYRKLKVVRLMAEDIAKPADLPGEEVASEYEATKAKYSAPEQRRVQQIVFKDKAEADAALAKLAAGDTFESILAAQGRTVGDADLGLLRKDQIPDTKVADAAFAQELNKPSGIIEGLFGPVVINVAEVVPQSVKPLAEVEADVRRELALKKASEDLFATHDKVEDERAAGDPLADAAAKAGLKVIEVAAVDASGNGPDGTPVEGLPSPRELLAEAFKTDVGVEADPVNIGTEGFAWFEVAEIKEQRQKTLDEVKAEATAAWLADETAKAVAALAERLTKRINGSEAMAAALIAEIAPSASPAVTPATSGELLRSDTADPLTAEAVRQGFALAGNSTFTVAGPKAPQQLVVKVARIVPGETGTAPAQTAERLNAQLAEDISAGFVEALKAGREVIINPAAIEAAIAF